MFKIYPEPQKKICISYYFIRRHVKHCCQGVEAMSWNEAMQLIDWMSDAATTKRYLEIRQEEILSVYNSLIVRNTIKRTSRKILYLRLSW